MIRVYFFSVRACIPPISWYVMLKGSNKTLLTISISFSLSRSICTLTWSPGEIYNYLKIHCGISTASSSTVWKLLMWHKTPKLSSLKWFLIFFTITNGFSILIFGKIFKNDLGTEIPSVQEFSDFLEYENIRQIFLISEGLANKFLVNSFEFYSYPITPDFFD